MAMRRVACAPGTPQGPVNAGVKNPKMQWGWTQGEASGKMLGAPRVWGVWGLM